ncbi:hypothetical protein SAMN06298226_0117 [Nitrosovibrio sp. Nv4]|nr:hypothetical protein SAMN06298226_0117 [Nitrosovibrio sp. Nv4]
MSLNLDSETITIRCPHCSIMYEEIISRLKYEPKLSCPSCEKYVGVNLLELYTALESVQSSCDALLQKLANGPSGRGLS